ncbi:MAG: ATP-dependent helicase, partial [Oscillospiraceae bacterium]
MEIVNFLQKRHNIVLNHQQTQAVNCISGNTLLLAVPGSGKTTVLVSRIANLMVNYSVKPESILTLTFSKETAKDMNARFKNLFESQVEIMPKFQTIHSFCYNVMMFYAKVKSRKMPLLFSEAKISQRQLLREIYNRFSKSYLNDDLLDNILLNICYAKNQMLSAEQIKPIESEIQNFTKIFSEYEKYKKEHLLIDYDDMLLYTYQIFVKLPNILNHISQKYLYINVDEAQDTSLVQHKIIKLMSKNATIFMVGDEDQSIYSFRGASPDQLLSFSQDYENAKIIKMEQNFRSNNDIVVQSDFFIKQNKKRYEKKMFCANKNKNSIAILTLVDYNRQYANVVEIVKKYASEQTIGILYRNNDTAIPLINEFNKENINFYLKEQNPTFFTSYVIKDIFAFISLARNGKNINAFKQI